MSAMTVYDSTPSLAGLIAKYGSSSTTAWLENERYRIWRPSEPVLESSFTPVQGYMEKDPYIFAWGNPLVSSTAALPSVAVQFAAFAQGMGKRPVWLCIDRDLADVLGKEFGWSAVCCLHEDEVDPSHVLALTSPLAKGTEGQRIVKDLKKNLSRAEKAGVDISQVKAEEWTQEEKNQVEQGIMQWRAGKHGIQTASTSLQPWLDFEHRRYWVARIGREIVGILILTPIQGGNWQIKNALSFPSAPKGTSETLIYTMLKDIDYMDNISPPLISKANTKPRPLSSSSSTTESSDSDSDDRRTSMLSTNGHSRHGSSDDEIDTRYSQPYSPGLSQINQLKSTIDSGAYTKQMVTFGISAAPHLQPIHNLQGWKVTALSKTYSKILSATGVLRRGEFRSKFDSHHVPMYVSYPPDRFGIDGANSLLKVLRK